MPSHRVHFPCIFPCTRRARTVKENGEQALRAPPSVRNTFARSTMWQRTRVYPYEYKTYTRFLVRCARTRNTLTRGRLTDHLPGSRARKTKQVPMFFPARRRVSYSRFSTARDFPLASFEKKSRFDPRRGVSRRLTIARQTTHSPRDRACDRLSWIHEATRSLDRYCTQDIVYR